jgi:hypothetical protein
MNKLRHKAVITVVNILLRKEKKISSLTKKVIEIE